MAGDDPASLWTFGWMDRWGVMPWDMERFTLSQVAEISRELREQARNARREERKAGR